MCGLYGLIGPGIQKKDMDVYRALGIISMLRGMDAAGIFETDSNQKGRGGEKFHKVGGDFTWLLYDMFWEYDYVEKKGVKRPERKAKLLTSLSSNLVMGHNRAATRGGWGDKNAHPFRTENLVGAHNGTLNDPRFQAKDQTDSELMFQACEKDGVVETLTNLKGANAWAVTIWDRAEKKFIMGRNDQRPLWYAINKQRAVLYWASEEEILRCALDREGIEYDIWQLHENMIVSIRPTDVKAGNDRIFQILWDARMIKPKVTQHNPLAPKKHFPDNHPLNRGGTILDADFQPPAFLTHKKEKEEDNVVPFTMDGKNVKLKAVAVQLVENDPAKDDPKIRHRLLNCSCGEHHLNMMDSYKTRIRAHGYPEYNSKDDCFKCDIASTNKIVC